MTNEEIAANMSAGARRAFLAFTDEWQAPGKNTFNWSGAQQAVKQAPEHCEYAAIKFGRQKYARGAYRLKQS